MDHHRLLQLAALAVRLGLLEPSEFDTLQRDDLDDADVTARLSQLGALGEDDLRCLNHLLDRCLPHQPEWLDPLATSSRAASSWDATPPPPMPLGPAAHQPGRSDRDLVGSPDDPTVPPESPFSFSASSSTSSRRYRIEKLHATGGIGRVWIARDDSLGRAVALKDLRPETGQPAHQLRFLEEARVTARLEHPGIVPVYELGRRETDGQPFYVMRFVKGSTLQEAIASYHRAREPVAFQRLLQAFRAIGQTLAYAHAQGVLHRDLKPANILLGSFGEVLVLDWGLAKTKAPGDAVPNAEVGREQVSDSSTTRAGQVLGTPAYMSPEQAAGQVDAIDARSDVWGLGAILYEILTGMPPFRGKSVAETLGMVQNSNPIRPRTLIRDIPAALEAICLKALAKNPDERYESAAALIDDVNRWLADEPVQAYRAPIAQRLARWARRHRTLVTTASGVLLAAVAVLAVSTILIGQQRARAEANLQVALDAVETFYVQVSEDRLLDVDGMQDLRASLLGSAVHFCRRFAADNERDPRRRADLARMHLLLGRVQAQIKEPSEAISSLERAREMFAALRREAPDDPDWIRGEAQAQLNIAVSLRLTEPTRAKSAYQSAIAGLDQLLKVQPDSRVDQEKLALAHNGYAHWLRDHDRFDDARAEYDQALRIIESLAAAAPANRDYQHHLAGFHANMGEWLLNRRELKDARGHLEKAFSIREELAARKIKDLTLDEHLAGSHNLLGHLSMMEKNLPEAEKHFREALKLRELVVLRNPNVHRYRDLLGWDHSNLSRVLLAAKKQDAAIVEIGKAVAVIQALRSDYPEETIYVRKLGMIHLNQGFFLYASDRSREAIVAFTEAIRWLDPASGRKDLLNAYWTRAMAKNDVGAYADAVMDYDRALEFDDGAQRKTLEEERQAALARAKKPG